MIFSSSTPSPPSTRDDLWLNTDTNVLMGSYRDEWRVAGYIFKVYVKGIFRKEIFLAHDAETPNNGLDVYLETDAEYARFLLIWQ